MFNLDSFLWLSTHPLKLPYSEIELIDISENHYIYLVASYFDHQKEDLMMNVEKEKWLCLDCWKRIIAKPGEKPPFPTIRLICDECGKTDRVTKVTSDVLSHSSR